VLHPLLKSRAVRQHAGISISIRPLLGAQHAALFLAVGFRGLPKLTETDCAQPLTAATTIIIPARLEACFMGSM
jgi:hypothetical protein